MPAPVVFDAYLSDDKRAKGVYLISTRSAHSKGYSILDFRCGSKADLLRLCSERPKLGVKQT